MGIEIKDKISLADWLEDEVQAKITAENIDRKTLAENLNFPNSTLRKICRAEVGSVLLDTLLLIADKFGYKVVLVKK